MTTSDGTDNPDVGDVIRDIVGTENASQRICYMGRVLDYDHDEQRAEVQPIVEFARYDEETGARTTYQPGPVANCPVSFQATGQGSITDALQVGDRVTCIVADRSHDRWLATDDDRVQPQSGRRFDLSDTIVLPGGRSFADPLTEVADNAMVIAHDTEIHLGQANPGDWVALASLVKGELEALREKVNDLVSAFNAHGHQGVTPGGGVSGTITDQAATPPAPVGTVSPADEIDDVKSDKVRSE